MTRSSLLGLGVGAGGGVLVLLAGVVLAVRACGGEEPKAPPGPSRATEIGSAGMAAKGTAELRQAGCEHAVVVDAAQLLGSVARIRPGEPRTMVTCDVSSSAAAPPGCDVIASTYFRAAGTTIEGNVSVRVVVPGGKGPSCSRLYAPSGADLGEFPKPP